MTERELPRYRSHKEVWALKIRSIEVISDAGAKPAGAMIHPEESGYAPIMVDQKYMTRHDPKVGGYYVQYRDGYKSWSPASEFEDGYTRI